MSYVVKVGVAQNLETLVLATERLKEVNFNIVGHGPECEKNTTVGRIESTNKCNFLW